MTKIFYFLGHEQFQPEVLVKHAQLAEVAGFDGVCTSEHFNPWVADLGAAGFAFSTLGAIAQATKRVELMTGIVTPLFRYHPAIIAQATATVDRLSNGRFSLGVGTGEPLNEVPLGYQFPPYKERAARMQEALEIMERLFKGEKVSFKGLYYTTENAHLYSPPLHKIPMYLAAGGPKTATLAAQCANGIIVSVKKPDETMTNIISPALEITHKENKPFTIVGTRWTVFAHNKDDAWKALGAWRGLRAPSKESATDPLTLQNEADTMNKEDILSKYTIVSSEQDYINAYKPLIETVKADIIVMQTTSVNQEQTIEMLGKDVLPKLRTNISL